MSKAYLPIKQFKFSVNNKRSRKLNVLEKTLVCETYAFANIIFLQERSNRSFVLFSSYDGYYLHSWWWKYEVSIKKRSKKFSHDEGIWFEVLEWLIFDCALFFLGLQFPFTSQTSPSNSERSCSSNSGPGSSTSSSSISSTGGRSLC